LLAQCRALALQHRRVLEFQEGVHGLGSLAVVQRPVDVSLYGRAKLDRHAGRRRTPAQKASSVNGSTSPLSSAAARRMASARISSGPAGACGAGRLPRILSAKCSRSLSGSRRAAASISWRVFMAGQLAGKSADARRGRNPRSPNPGGPCVGRPLQLDLDRVADNKDRTAL